MFAAATSLLALIWVIIGTIIVVWAVSWLYRYVMTKKYKSYGGEIEADQFESTMRKAQVIDLRETADFERSHIMGARHVPYTQFSERMKGLRKDMPVYMYDGTGVLCLRAAKRLQKAGFTQIYWLKDGFEAWSGKVKSKK